MFTRHTTDFAQITSVDAAPGAMLTLSAETMLETRRGWQMACDLRPADELASLDGGFAPLAWIRRAAAQPGFLVPATALGNCSDVILPDTAQIGLDAPTDFDAQTDTLSLPLRGLAGWRGIRKASAPVQMISLGLASEEMLWTQTGMLVHAQPLTAPWFHTLSFTETRALLALHMRNAAPLARAA